MALTDAEKKAATAKLVAIVNQHPECTSRHDEGSYLAPPTECSHPCDERTGRWYCL
jgi:hypothetical protein